LNASITEAGPFERLLTFTLAAADIEAAKTKAAQRLSREINIKGFRPGKAPRPIVEATVGAAKLRSEAIEELLPAKVGEVLVESDLRPAVAPAVEDLRDVLDGVEVHVRVTLWPSLDDLPDYEGRKVEIPSPELSDDELLGQITRLREQYASLETVERVAALGDYAAIDIVAEHNGLPVEDANAKDLLYEVGSGEFIQGIDEQLVGKAAGDTFVFGGPLPEGFGKKAGLPVSFTVTVTEVKKKVLADLDDEWVAENTEFETVEELTTRLAEQLREIKRRSVSAAFQDRAFETLVNEVQVEIPRALLRAEMDEILHRFGHRLGERGVKIEDYFRVTGLTDEEFVGDLERQADRTLRGQFLLEAVVRREGLRVDDEEVAAAVDQVAARSDDVEHARRMLREPERELALRSDILRGKALAAITAKAEPVDADGNPVDLTVPAAGETSAPTFEIEEAELDS